MRMSEKMSIKVKDVDALREQISKDPREAFTKHQVWLFASEHNKTVPTIEAYTKDEVMAMLTDILERIKAGDIKEEKADNDWGEGFIEAWGSANLNAQMVVEEKINSLKEK
jgi:hypothetical protein